MRVGKGPVETIKDGNEDCERTGSAGLTNPRVFHSSDDPNEVVIFFTTNDTAKAKDFVASLDLKNTMAKAGVVETDRPSFSLNRSNHRGLWVAAG